MSSPALPIDATSKARQAKATTISYYVAFVGLGLVGVSLGADRIYASKRGLSQLRLLGEIVKAKVLQQDGHAPVVPIVVPALEEVRSFAASLHKVGEHWEDEIFGWSAKYNPGKAEPPLDSKMTFTPADFCIGESGIWFFSMMWEHGHDAPPAEFLDNKNLVLVSS